MYKILNEDPEHNNLSSEIHFKEPSKYEFKHWRKLEGPVKIQKFEITLYNVDEQKLKNRMDLQIETL